MRTTVEQPTPRPARRARRSAPASFGSSVASVASVANWCALAIALAGCPATEPDPEFCDEKNPCAAGRACDLPTRTCVAQEGRDLAVPDAASDAASDAAPDAGCAAAVDCPAMSPVCERGVCRSCGGPGDDAACAGRDPSRARCDPGSGACVPCRDSSHCAAAAPVCDARECRTCGANDECASGACGGDGRCVDIAAIVHVDLDHGGTACAGAVHQGTDDDPYCGIADAIAGRAGRGVILVDGAGTPYAPFALSDAVDLRVIGRAEPAPPVISGLGRFAVTLSHAAAGAASLAVEDLVIQGDRNGAIDAVYCVRQAGAAALALRGVTVERAGGSAVLSLRCAVSITRSTLRTTDGYGVSVAGGSLALTRSIVTDHKLAGVSVSSDATYTIENDLVYDNRGPGLLFDSTGTGTVRFVTLAYNGRANASGGVVCGLGPQRVIEASIVADNTRDAMNSQLAGSCAVKDVVTGPDGFMGTVKLQPDFVAAPPAADVRLAAGSQPNRACCVDKIPKAAGLPDVDVDGTPRPRGGGLDIGAHELE